MLHLIAIGGKDTQDADIRFSSDFAQAMACQAKAEDSNEHPPTETP